MDSHLGRTVLNFRIEEKLGEGSFGIVYRARHIDLGREVAIKVLRPEHSRDRAAVSRFLREARLVCAIDHPAIVEVENSGMLDDEPFYLMELVPGRSLAQRLADDGPLPVGQLRVVFREVAAALAAAHAKGVVHRDLKPHNIMIVEDGNAIAQVKLFDFGIAKLLENADAGSQTGGLMGTPHFMAPEQARDAKSVDVRADVYGFAATFFAASTGRRPFEGDSVTEVLLAVQQDPPPPLSRFLPAATPALVAAVDRCLAKRPGERPATVQAAADEILAELARMPDDAIAPRGTRAPRSHGAAVTLTSGPTDPGDAAAATASRSALVPTVTLKGSIDGGDVGAEGQDRPRGRAIAIWLVAIAIAAGLALLARRRGEPRDEERGAAPAAASASGSASASSSTPAAIDARGSGAAAVVALAALQDAPTQAALVATTPAPVPPDAAPATGLDPRGTAADHAHRIHPAHPPTAPAAAGGCAKPDFAAVYGAPAPPDEAVRAALRRLRECRDLGELTADEYESIQTALVAKL